MLSELCFGWSNVQRWVLSDEVRLELGREVVLRLAKRALLLALSEVRSELCFGCRRFACCCGTMTSLLRCVAAASLLRCVAAASLLLRAAVSLLLSFALLLLLLLLLVTVVKSNDR